MPARLSKDALKIFRKLIDDAIEEEKKLLRIYDRHQHQKPDFRTKARRSLARINRLRDIKPLDPFRFFADRASRTVGNALAFMENAEWKYYTTQVLRNKFNCSTPFKELKARETFTRIGNRLLRDPNGFDGAAVIWGLSSEPSYDSKTNTVIIKNPLISALADVESTIFGQSIVKDSMIDLDYENELEKGICQEMLRTFIHEAVHRLLDKVKHFTEVYEFAEKKKFASLSCESHLANADSFASVYLNLSDAYVRIQNATVTTEGIEAYELKEIYRHDTLWDLAEFFYGDPLQWEMLWESNKDRLKSGNPHRIYPGETILVPYQ